MGNSLKGLDSSTMKPEISSKKRMTLSSVVDTKNSSTLVTILVSTIICPRPKHPTKQDRQSRNSTPTKPPSHFLDLPSPTSRKEAVQKRTPPFAAGTATVNILITMETALSGIVRTKIQETTPICAGRKPTQGRSSHTLVRILKTISTVMDLHGHRIRWLPVTSTPRQSGIIYTL